MCMVGNWKTSINKNSCSSGGGGCSGSGGGGSDGSGGSGGSGGGGGGGTGGGGSSYHFGKFESDALKHFIILSFIVNLANRIEICTN